MEVRARCNSEDQSLQYQVPTPRPFLLRNLNSERRRLRSYSQSEDEKEGLSNSTSKSHLVAALQIGQTAGEEHGKSEHDCFEKFRDLETQWNSVKSALHPTNITPLRTNAKRTPYNFVIPEEPNAEKSPSINKEEAPCSTREGFALCLEETSAKTARTAAEEGHSAMKQQTCQKLTLVHTDPKTVGKRALGKVRKSTPGQFQTSLMRSKKSRDESNPILWSPSDETATSLLKIAQELKRELGTDTSVKDSKTATMHTHRPPSVASTSQIAKELKAVVNSRQHITVAAAKSNPRLKKNTRGTKSGVFTKAVENPSAGQRKNSYLAPEPAPQSRKDVAQPKPRSQNCSVRKQRVQSSSLCAEAAKSMRKSNFIQTSHNLVKELQRLDIKAPRTTTATGIGRPPKTTADTRRAMGLTQPVHDLLAKRCAGSGVSITSSSSKNNALVNQLSLLKQRQIEEICSGASAAQSNTCCCCWQICYLFEYQQKIKREPRKDQLHNKLFLNCQQSQLFMIRIFITSVVV